MKICKHTTYVKINDIRSSDTTPYHHTERGGFERWCFAVSQVPQVEVLLLRPKPGCLHNNMFLHWQLDVLKVGFEFGWRVVLWYHLNILAIATKFKSCELSGLYYISTGCIASYHKTQWKVIKLSDQKFLSRLSLTFICFNFLYWMGSFVKLWY